MRAPFAIFLIITILFAGGYFYQSAQAICQVPIEYRIGVLDDRFNLTFEEARLAMADAEAAWEDITDKNLFAYNETADFAVNFIFDERQALADAEDTFKERLDVTEQVSEAIQKTYEELAAEYESADATYKSAAAGYEKRLDQYNQMVSKYNAEGGAPPEVFAELESEKKTLDREQSSLNAQIKNLNDLVEQVNQIGNRGNQLIETYNRGVETYNQTFGDSREFTQGDYTGDSIHIYTFADPIELRLVLVHELGHALTLDHVDDSVGVMHYLLGEQDGYDLTEADRGAFEAVCALSTGQRLQQQFARLLSL